MQTRRTFIKNGLLIFVAASGAVTYGNAIEKTTASPNDPKYAMIVISQRCMGCNSCMAACKLQNGTAENLFLTTVKRAEEGNYPDIRETFHPTGCHHCANPPCITACPEGAILKLDNSIVITNWEKCTGDGACVDACPYNARIIDPAESKADSCDFCLHLVSQGHRPSCVGSCPTKARLFGDLNNPEGEFAKALHKAQHEKGFSSTSLHYL